MVITRTPLRLAIGGGGTDLPSYYSRFGSYFISAAINKYMYITFYRSSFVKNFRLKYSRMEDVGGLENISHAIVREKFRLHDINDSAEMASHADVPGGTGLGTSGSFGVGLSHAIHATKGRFPSPEELAEEATRVQMDILNYPIGKQDQYAAAFGGFNGYSIEKDGSVTVEPINIGKDVLEKLEHNLLMFYTGISRSASDILITQKEKSEKDDEAMIEGLHFIQKLGYETKDALESGDLDNFGQIMNTHWEKKKMRSDKMTNPQIDEWYNGALENGAVGGKVVGAGGGGFLMFYAQDSEKLTQHMKDQGLPRMNFNFDFDGSKVLVNE